MLVVRVAVELEPVLLPEAVAVALPESETLLVLLPAAEREMATLVGVGIVMFRSGACAKTRLRQASRSSERRRNSPRVGMRDLNIAY